MCHANQQWSLTRRWTAGDKSQCAIVKAATHAETPSCPIKPHQRHQYDIEFASGHGRTAPGIWLGNTKTVAAQALALAVIMKAHGEVPGLGMHNRQIAGDAPSLTIPPQRPRAKFAIIFEIAGDMPCLAKACQLVQLLDDTPCRNRLLLCAQCSAASAQGLAELGFAGHDGMATRQGRIRAPRYRRPRGP